MRNIIIVFLLAACLAAPVKASAFGFGDIVTYGRKVLRIGQPRPAPVKVDERKAESVLPADARDQWKEKYGAWKSAYDKGDISTVFVDPKNLTISEQEINYFALKEYNAATTSIVRDLRVDFRPGIIVISGYSMLNNLKGDFTAEVKVMEGLDGLYLKVAKARLGKMWVPAILLDNIVKKETKKLKEFLYSSESHQNLKVVIEEDVLRLEYEQ